MEFSDRNCILIILFTKYYAIASVLFSSAIYKQKLVRLQCQPLKGVKPRYVWTKQCNHGAATHQNDPIVQRIPYELLRMPIE